jgi:hypothetical protein
MLHHLCIIFFACYVLVPYASPAKSLHCAGLDGTPTSVQRGQHSGRPTATAAGAAGEVLEGRSTAPAPSVVLLPSIQSLDDLFDAISEHRPGTVQRFSSQGQQNGIRVVLEADLGGRTLEAPTRTHQLLIPPGLKLRLLNGALHLPHSVIILVGPGAEVELERVDIRGRGIHEHGLITVEGAGASATLRQCAITGGGEGGTVTEQVHGVLVAKGGQAVLQHCTIMKATKCGIHVQNKGSAAQVTSTMVQQCDEHGYLARGRGKLVLERSIAHSNGGDGFCADKRGMLQAGPGCRSERNGWIGFRAHIGARLLAGEGCYAGGNGHDGYTAHGLGSRLDAGPGCIAEHNGGTGFVAGAGARLWAGPKCTAQHNMEGGFWARKNGHLHALRECSAIQNAEAGFQAGGAAALIAESGCRAESNGNSSSDQWVQEDRGTLHRLRASVDSSV